MKAQIEQALAEILKQYPALPSVYQAPELSPDTPVAGCIDHTLLKPEATAEQIVTCCEEAKTYGFASVCVNPVYVPLVAEQLAGSDVKVCTVINFPLGADTPEAIAFEVRKALVDGADELDMVLNIGALKSGDYGAVYQGVLVVTRPVTVARKLSKVIIETSKLSDEEKKAACLIAQLAGADFVKTSTGFGGGGATVDDVRLMRQIVGPRMGVKASGGVRTLEDARNMIAAGATRIGASAGVKIVEGERSDSDY